MPVATLLLVVVFLMAPPLGGVAHAQSTGQVQIGPATPNVELGAQFNFLELFSRSSLTLGGRLAKRHLDWLHSELAYDRTSWNHNDQTSRVLVAGLRLQGSALGAGGRPFVSVGVARGHRMSFEWSPAVSVGVHHAGPSSALAFRFELQAFLRGRSLEEEVRESPQRNANVTQWPGDRFRVLVGVGVGIP